jgi:hypothetical protein
VTIGELVKQLKGVTSKVIAQRANGLSSFRWQPGYGVFSVGSDQVARVREYITRQKQHHANGTLQPALEQTGNASFRPGVERTIEIIR